jgi:hypothetical protein
METERRGGSGEAIVSLESPQAVIHIRHGRQRGAHTPFSSQIEEVRVADCARSCRASELFLFSMSSSRILARSELLRQRAVPHEHLVPVAGRWWVGIRSRSTAGGGGSSTMRRAATHRERQIQGCVNGYREWRKPNMSFKNMDAINVFCYRLSVGEDFLGEQYLQGPILNIG